MGPLERVFVMLTKLRDNSCKNDRILLLLLHPCALQLCCALHSFAFVFCSHTHPFLFLSTWFRSGVDSRHSDQGRFCCIFLGVASPGYGGGGAPAGVRWDRTTEPDPTVRRIRSP